MMIRWWWFDDDDDGGGGGDDDVDVDVVSNGQYSTSSQSFYHHHDGWCFSSFLTMEAIISFIPRLEFDEFRSVGVNRWPTVDLL